jgi:hypothetical protein
MAKPAERNHVAKLGAYNCSDRGKWKQLIMWDYNGNLQDDRRGTELGKSGHSKSNAR